MLPTYTDMPAVLLADVHLTGKNFRKRFDPEKHKELTQDVKNNGVLNPLTLRRRQAGGFWLVAGERRLRAATDAKLATVPGRVAENVDEKQAALLGYVENEGRDNLTGYEQASGLATLVKEYGYTGQELAKLTGKSVGHVNKLLKAMDALHPVVLAAWEAGNGALTKDAREKLMRMEDKEEQADNWRCLTEHGVFLDELETPPGADPGDPADPGAPVEAPPPPAKFLPIGTAEIKERYAAVVKACKEDFKTTSKWAAAAVNYVLGKRATPPEGVEAPVKEEKAEGTRGKRKAGEVAATA